MTHTNVPKGTLYFDSITTSTSLDLRIVALSRSNIRFRLFFFCRLPPRPTLFAARFILIHPFPSFFPHNNAFRRIPLIQKLKPRGCRQLDRKSRLYVLEESSFLSVPRLPSMVGRFSRARRLPYLLHVVNKTRRCASFRFTFLCHAGSELQRPRVQVVETGVREHTGNMTFEHKHSQWVGFMWHLYSRPPLPRRIL